MITDAQLLFSNAQAVTVSAASTNIVDQGVAGNALGGGAEPYVIAQIDEAFTQAGALNVTFDLQTATDAAFTSPVTLASSGAIAKASLTIGARPLRVRIPPGALRYLRMYYTASDTASAGKVTAFITPETSVQ